MLAGTWLPIWVSYERDVVNKRSYTEHDDDIVIDPKVANQGRMYGSRAAFVLYALGEGLSLKLAVSPYGALSFQCACAVFW